MKGKKILVVDDDPNLCEMLSLTFSMVGASVFMANDGTTGLRTFFQERPDLVILDVLLPDMDGWEVCRQIRLMANTPVIMLTTMNSDADMIKGLDNGADDYIAKPFTGEVLIARARALLRRSSFSQPKAKPQKTYKDEYLYIDLDTYRVLVDGETVKLSATEFKLLSYLLQNTGRVLTYDQILQYVWGPEYRGSVDYVHVYVSHLRRKLEANPKQAKYLQTEHGIGYRFESYAMAYS